MIVSRKNCLFKELLRSGFRMKYSTQTIKSYSRLCCGIGIGQKSLLCNSASSNHFLWSRSDLKLRAMSSNNINDGSEDCETVQDNTDKFDELFDDLFLEKGIEEKVIGHNVFVIQPYIKWGPSKKNLTTPPYQLDESVALIDTLKDWSVVGSELVPLTTTKSPKVFGKGKLEALTKIIKSDESITAVFLSLNVLSKVQQDFLEETFGLPVFDRYSVVMRIFREHAVTKEAKLQVAMAEIPQLWRNLSLDKYRARGGNTHSVGGAGETFYEIRKNLIKGRESKLKAALKSLKKHRDLMRSKRKKRQFPTIAVVGYTNAGKTSLIKALTQEEEMEPKNELFATLDVTCHRGVLPSNIKVLYIDTIGFISDIPTMLIEPFIVTLEDALEADLIIHVIDVSNPDYVAQSAHVEQTLQQLNVDKNLLENVIVVANKVDLLTSEQLRTFEGMLQISCTSSFGLSRLREEVERMLLNVTDRMKLRIRVANGGPEFSWLYKESSVVDVVADASNAQFIYMDVIITRTNLEKFKFEFIMRKKRERLKHFRD